MLDHSVSHSDYVRAIRGDLPKEAFRPHAGAYVWILVHFSVVIAGWVVIAQFSRSWWPLACVAICVSMASLAFLAHDVAHRSITTNKYLLYPTELVLWGIMYVPATLWRRLHATHHAHTNTEKDPDRRFLESELSGTGAVAGAVMFPNRRLGFSFLHLLYWVYFPFRHGIVALFYPDKDTPHFVTGKPRYKQRDKIFIAFEFVAIGLFQFYLNSVLGGAGYFRGVVIPVAVTSAVVSWYFFTNHGLKPVDNGDDILAATTTVRVPKICDRLHSNFSYHTEHHLFPNMNPKYYPLVSDLFRKHFPERYHCISINEAWGQLLKNSIATQHTDHARETVPHDRALERTGT